MAVAIEDAQGGAGRRWLRAVGKGAAVFVPAALVEMMPALFLYLGVYALGGKLGWWIGDPTFNDGEETWGLVLGVGGTLFVLALVTLVVHLGCRKRPGEARRVWVVGVVLFALTWLALALATGGRLF
ncbi:MAG TPA: hypothetical protein VGC18_09985 [Lacisediminihabitans sp.]